MRALLRHAIALLAALVGMGALFAGLQALVAGSDGGGEPLAAARLEFTRLGRDSEVQVRRAEKPKLELRRGAPAAPVAAIMAGSGAGAGAGSGPTLPAAPQIPGALPGVGQVGGLQKLAVFGAGSDRDALPLVRVEPEYPPRAVERGIEGWVQLRFDITAAGAVAGAVVVDSEPEGVFDEAALRAVSRWRYNPKLEAGVAVERRGVQVILRFVAPQKGQR